MDHQTYFRNTYIVYCRWFQAPSCEHAFCRSCIEEWLGHQSNCPVDRQNVVAAHLTLVPRILRNLLARLQIECDNQQYVFGFM